MAAPKGEGNSIRLEERQRKVFEKKNFLYLKCAGNPIGELQEFCVKNGLPIPIYDLGSVDGQPHKRSFVMIAKVGVVHMAGNGTSKKVSIFLMIRFYFCFTYFSPEKETFPALKF